MIDIVQLALKYLRFHWIKTGILVLAIALIVFLPFGLDILVRHGSESLLARAQTTPLVLGQKASPLELVLNTLYFDTSPPPEIAFAELARINESGLATAIPLYNRFRAKGFPIVGTNTDYFAFRNLRVAEGRHPLLIGECVLGADVADALSIAVGDYVISTPEELFDFAGTYPLKMEVVGLLAGTGTPDDGIILTDIKTAWIITGIAHGHEDVSQSTAEDTILRRESSRIVTNASIVTYNVIDDSNRSSYHFHGEMADFPLTSVIALPDDQRAKALLQGRYLKDGEAMQLVAPPAVVASLLGTVFKLREYLLLGSLLAVVSTFSTAALVFILSLRLRKREIETMHRIGLPRSRVAGLLATEIAIVIAIATILATFSSYVFSQYVDTFILKLLS